MKRGIAIVGPTPPFVRWAIRHDCRLRNNRIANLPDGVFRQLRSLRELSLARIENRIVDGVCVHGQFNEDAARAKGFVIREVTDYFGGEAQIEESCVSCPANAEWAFTGGNGSTMPPTWSGCFGWLKSEYNGVKLIEIFETCDVNVTALELDLERLPNRNWYRVWRRCRWRGHALGELNRLLNAVNGSIEIPVNDISHLISASRRCLEHEMELETELVPAGVADGPRWTILPHCPFCRVTMARDAIECAECGRRGGPHPPIFRKILGFRPYLSLIHVIGEKRTSALIAEFHRKRATGD
jgi:hypothetical protein